MPEDNIPEILQLTLHDYSFCQISEKLISFVFTT